MSPSVGSGVCTSTGEVGRGAIKVMGLYCCALQTSWLYYKLTILCGSSLIMRVLLSCIDIGSVSVFTVQIDDTTDETEVSAIV